MKYIIFFNTKGGVGKSTLCEYSARELSRLGYSVQVENLDQQSHVTELEAPGADFFLYDTFGAFTRANVDLLEAAKGENAVIVVPLSTSDNDFKEVPFLVGKLKEHDLINQALFVFNGTPANSKYLAPRRAELKALGVTVAPGAIPHLTGFKHAEDTPRIRREVSSFLHKGVI